MRAFIYVIASDRGTAPCFGDGWATLALCKPAIRRGAKPGDLIIAFNGRDLGEPHRVRWAGVVKEKLGFDRYWHDRRFENRPDNIYRPARGEFEHVGGTLHAGEEHRGRDLGGWYVLVFERWWHFRNDDPLAPEALWMTKGRRGHKVIDGVSADWLGAPRERVPGGSPGRAGRGCAPERPPGVGCSDACAPEGCR